MTALRRACPEAKLNIVANRQVAALALDAVKVSEVKFLDDAEFAPFFSPVEARRVNYFHRDDLVISYLHDPDKVFEGNVRASGVEHFQAGPSKIVGSSHAAEQLAETLHALDVPIGDFAPRLNIGERAAQQAERKLGAPVAVLIHPGSGSRRKIWPIAKWIQLIRDFLNRGVRIGIVGGEADYREVARLRDHFRTDLSFVVDWPLRELAALLASRVFLGHDSGISHLAAASGAHSLLLFGPSNPKVWAPKNANARILLAPDGDLDQFPLAAVYDALDQELIRIGIRT